MNEEAIARVGPKRYEKRNKKTYVPDFVLTRARQKLVACRCDNGV